MESNALNFEDIKDSGEKIEEFKDRVSMTDRDIAEAVTMFMVNSKFFGTTLGDIENIGGKQVVVNRFEAKGFNSGDQSRSLTPIGDNEYKINNNVFSRSAIKNIANTLRKINTTDEVIENAEEVMRKINVGKLVTVAIRPGTTIMEVRGTMSRGVVRGLIWEIDSKDSKLVAYVQCKFSYGDKSRKIRLDEFNKTFTAVYNDILANGHINCTDILEYTERGELKPVELIGNKCSFVIDCRNIYMLVDNVTLVIGKINSSTGEYQIDGKLIQVYGKEYCEELTELARRLEFIAKHSNGMLPYIISDTHKCRINN